MKPNTTVTRVNWRGLIGTAAALVIGIGGVFGASLVLNGQTRRAAVDQVKLLQEKKDYGLALRHAAQFLKTHPDDVEMLELQADLATETAVNVQGMIGAATLQERLIRLDPESPERQENRKRLAELDILISEWYASRLDRTSAYVQGRKAQESRFLTALKILEEVVDRDRRANRESDVATHRLLARAHEGLALPGNAAELEAALREYRLVRAVEPSDPFSADRLARLLRDRSNEPVMADQVIASLVEEAPESSEAWLTARRYYIDTKQPPEKATEALRQAARYAPPGDYTIRLMEAAEALAQRDIDGARAILDGLPEEEQARPEVQRLRGWASQLEDNPEAALASYRKALMSAQGSAPTDNLTVAMLLLEMGQLDDARAAVANLRRTAGDQVVPAAALLDAMIDERAGRLDVALKKLAEAEPDLPDAMLPQLLLTRGRCYRKTGDRDRAMSAFREALRVNPELAEARVEIALLLQQDRPDEALAELRQGSDNPAIRLTLARALLRRQAALPADRRNWAEFEQAIAAASAGDGGTDPAVIALKAQRLAVEGQTVEAARMAEAGLAGDPTSIELWTVWAEALAVSGQLEGAAGTLERAAEPGNVGDHASLRIARSNLLIAMGRGREGLAILTAPADALPPEQRAMLMQAEGRLRAARGEIAQARAVYLRWADLQPGSIDPQVYLLQLAITIGDVAGAQAALDAIRGRAGQGGEDTAGLAYRLGRAEYLVRMAGPSGPGPEALEEAAELLDNILGSAPNFGSASLLRGRVRELQRDPRGAIADYLSAYESGVDNALPLLVNAMVRADRQGEIAALSRPSPLTLTTCPERFAAEACLEVGRVDDARAFLERAEAALPRTPDVANWRLSMLDRLGDRGQVERELAEATRRAPEDMAGWTALIRYQVQRGEIEAARQSMARLLPTVAAERRSLVEAQCLAALGDMEGADQAMERALLEAPNDPNLIVAAARHYQESGRQDRARQILRELLAQQPENRQAARLLALSLSGGGNTDPATWQEAWEVLGPEPAEGSSEAPEDRLTRAIVLARSPDRQRSAEAAPLLETLVADQPAGQPLAVAARETLVRALMAMGQPERAAQVAAVTATSSPNSGAIRLYLEALIQSKNWTEARRQIDRLSALAPLDPEVARLRVRLIEGTTEPDKLVAALEAAFRTRAAEPDAAIFGLSLAQRLLGLGEPGRAAAMGIAEEVARRSPADAWLLAQVLASVSEDGRALDAAETAIRDGNAKSIFEASRALLTIGQRAGGPGAQASRIDSLFTEATDKQPDLPGLKAIVAMWRHLQGNYGEEIRLYGELLAADPDNALYNNNMAWALCEGMQQPEEALRHIDLSMRRSGRMKELLDTRGVVLTRLKRYDEAIADLTEATRGPASPSPVFLFHLARAYQAAGRTAEAKAAMERATEGGLKPDQVEPFERNDLAALAAL